MFCFAGSTTCSGRQPMVVQNGPQVQQQLTQQMQALSLYQNPAPVEPPPPYPLGSSSPGPLPPPSYSASIQVAQKFLAFIIHLMSYMIIIYIVIFI